jgi:hypothetical protein
MVLQKLANWFLSFEYLGFQQFELSTGIPLLTWSENEAIRPSWLEFNGLLGLPQNQLLLVESSLWKFKFWILNFLFPILPSDSLASGIVGSPQSSVVCRIGVEDAWIWDSHRCLLTVESNPWIGKREFRLVGIPNLFDLMPWAPQNPSSILDCVYERICFWESRQRGPLCATKINLVVWVQNGNIKIPMF